ncbi:YkgJ family cysteine cluster protein [Desulfolithobacter dissulfuricans]|nr:YkgJ family cysteine cluster protein [Desulfolithobacter dissulfuricans]
MKENKTPSPATGQRIALNGGDTFRFRCHPDISCYLACCHKVEIYLFPYDVLRLKNCLGMHSAEFIHTHCRIGEGSHPYFPSLMLNMAEQEDYPCPFLTREGCSVYPDRPSACRTYPLERGVEKCGRRGRLKTHYFLVRHPYCKGHDEEGTYTVKQWERDQKLLEYNLMNDLWAELDAFFATNPWEGEGAAGPRQQLAFMVCYDIDGFRDYASRHHLLDRYRIDRDRRRRIERDDAELLKFGFQWLPAVLGGRNTLTPT